MRYAMIFTVLSLSLGSMAADAVNASDATDAHNWDDFLDHLHDIRNIQDLQDLLSLGIGRWGNNPCERVGGTCDLIAGGTFCTGTFDVALSGLPCSSAVGAAVTRRCCWHAPRI